MEVLPPPQLAARSTRIKAIEKAAEAESEFAKLERRELRIKAFLTRKHGKIGQAELVTYVPVLYDPKIINVTQGTEGVVQRMEQ